MPDEILTPAKGANDVNFEESLPQEQETSMEDVQPTEDETHKEPSSVPITRFKEIYRQKREAERQLLEKDREVSHWRTEFEKAKSLADQKPAASDEQSPDITKFETTEEYQKAVVQHEVQKEMKNFKQKQKEEDERAQNLKKIESFNVKIKEATEKIPDFIETVTPIAKNIAPILENIIADASNSAEIFYYLGKNPNEIMKLNSLHPISAAIEIGKLSMKIENEKIPIKKKSSAPDTTVSIGTREKTGSADIEKLPWKDYVAVMNKRDAERHQ